MTHHVVNQQTRGLYREPPEILERHGCELTVDGNRLLSFASNDYLGLATSQAGRDAVAQCFAHHAPSSSSSRVVGANFRETLEAERQFADYFGYEEAVFFPSGFQANLGLLAAVLGNTDCAVFDKRVHASTLYGLRASGARLMGYEHANYDHLERRLHAASGELCAVVTESLFSMDGDAIDIARLLTLKQQREFVTIVDEAHSFGVLGEGGRGLARALADVATGTLGKAFGLFGAFVLMPRGGREFLFNASSSLVYTTALPPAHSAAAACMLSLVTRASSARAYLSELSERARAALHRAGFDAQGKAHIISIPIGDDTEAATLAAGLRRRGVFVLAARPPTVPPGRAMLRISLTAIHKPADLDTLVVALQEARDEKR